MVRLTAHNRKTAGSSQVEISPSKRAERAALGDVHETLLKYCFCASRDTQGKGEGETDRGLQMRRNLALVTICPFSPANGHALIKIDSGICENEHTDRVPPLV